MNHWDRMAFRFARDAQAESKDGTKNGSCILRPDHTVASIGYNGLPRGLNDEELLQDREFKNLIVLHAEENAILNSHDFCMDGYTLYQLGLPCCGHCASLIAQKGIKRVCYAVNQDSAAWNSGSVKSRAALTVFEKCGISFEQYEMKDLGL